MSLKCKYLCSEGAAPVKPPSEQVPWLRAFVILLSLCRSRVSNPRPGKLCYAARVHVSQLCILHHNLRG